jgi:hypothetical protein
LNETPAAFPKPLRNLTIAFGLVIGIAALFGIGQTLAPSADQRAEDAAARFDLNTLAAGEPVVFVHGETVVRLLRLSPEQEAIAQETDLLDLRDTLARHAMLPHDASASFDNRTVNFDGPIVVMNARCDRGAGFIPHYTVNSFETWFCPRGTERYDVLGRRLDTGGLGQESFEIPPHTVTDDGYLILLTDAEMARLRGLDPSLYRSPN